MSDKVGFDEDVRPLFRAFAPCMAAVNVATDQGVFPVLLLDYDRVRLLNVELLTALRGHRPESRTAHPMPPGAPLPDEQIDLFSEWVRQGMPRTNEIEGPGEHVVVRSENPGGAPAHPADDDRSFSRWPNGTEGVVQAIGNASGWIQVLAGARGTAWFVREHLTAVVEDA